MNSIEDLVLARSKLDTFTIATGLPLIAAHSFHGMEVRKALAELTSDPESRIK